jgi:alpha-tubulin suppressor-like RCC1 family protein
MGWRFGQFGLRVGGGKGARYTRLAVVGLFMFTGVLVWAAAAGAESKPAPVKPYPAIEGSAEVGQLLKATTGTWKEPVAEYKYQWENCNAEGKECKAIKSETAKEYRVSPEMFKMRLRVKVTAKNKDGEETGKASEATVPVAEGPPVIIEPPTIKGNPEVGETLTATTGTWAGSEPITYAYKWEKCKEGCELINDATKETYSPSPEVAAGYKLRVTVTAKNNIDEVAAISEETTEVLPALKALAVGWGSNKPAGDLGAGYNDTYEVAPVIVNGLIGVDHVVAAGEASYAVLNTGEVKAWGGKGQGDLGDAELGPEGEEESGSTEAEEEAEAEAEEGYQEPVNVNELVGGKYEMAEEPAGEYERYYEKVEKHEFPQYVDGTSKPITNGIEVAGAFAAYTHGMVLNSEHKILTWGASSYGERGNGEYDNSPGVWEGHDCADKHPTYCYSVGTHDSAPRDVALEVPNETKRPDEPESTPLFQDENIVKIATGGDTDYALQEDSGGSQTLWSWGGNDSGKLGVGNEGKKITLTEGEGKTDKERREKEESEEKQKEVEGEFRCEGDGTSVGECSPEPRKVDLPEGVKITQISSSQRQTYALTSNEEVLAWGENTFGAIGNGKVGETVGTPTYVCGVEGKCTEHLKEVVAIAAGEKFALALLKSGKVVGWGLNAWGNLGRNETHLCEGTTEKKIECTPNYVEGLPETPVTQIAAGAQYSLAVSGGHVYTWGMAEGGQLGYGYSQSKKPCTSLTADQNEGCEAWPEECGTRTLTVGKRTYENVPDQCSKKPLEIGGLSGVEQITASDGADPIKNAYGHSFAIYKTHSGPEPSFTVKPEIVGGKPELKARWSVDAPGHEYTIRWKSVVPADNPKEEALVALKKEIKENKKKLAELEEEGKTVEAEGLKGVISSEEVHKKELEKEIDKAFPTNEGVKVTESGKKCAESPLEWCEQIEGIHNKEETVAIEAEKTYEITLSVSGGQGDSQMFAVAKAN